MLRVFLCFLRLSPWQPPLNIIINIDLTLLTDTTKKVSNVDINDTTNDSHKHYRQHSKDDDRDLGGETPQAKGLALFKDPAASSSSSSSPGSGGGGNDGDGDGLLQRPVSEMIVSSAIEFFGFMFRVLPNNTTPTC